MNIARFRHLADAYGADIARWPAEERADASSLLAQSEEAQRVLAQARVLDAWIALGAPEVEDAQVERVYDTIMNRVGRDSSAPVRIGAMPPGAARMAFFRPRTFLPAAAFLAGMAVTGVLAGAENLFLPSASATTADIASLVAPEPSYFTAWNQ
jgi:hypothetical protein